MALKINLGLVVLVVLSIAPFIFVDATLYRQPEFDNGCNANIAAQFDYLIYLQLIYYDVAVLFPIAMYPLLCYKHFARSGFRVGILQKGSIRQHGKGQTSD